MWVIDLFVNFFNPHLKVPAHLSTFEVLQAKECASTLSPSIVFTFGITIESMKELGGASMSLTLYQMGNHQISYLFFER